MTDLLSPPVAPQDVAPHVDAPVTPVDVPAVNTYITPMAAEPTLSTHTLDAAVQTITGERRRKPVTDVRVGRAILLAAGLKERKRNGQPLRTRTPVI